MNSAFDFIFHFVKIYFISVRLLRVTTQMQVFTTYRNDSMMSCHVMYPNIKSEAYFEFYAFFIINWRCCRWLIGYCPYSISLRHSGFFGIIPVNLVFYSRVPFISEIRFDVCLVIFLKWIYQGDDSIFKLTFDFHSIFIFFSMRIDLRAISFWLGPHTWHTK